jgi:methanogenic corrinoid protein MtbC1
MTLSATRPPSVDDYLQHAASGDTHAATRYVLDHMEAGTPVPALLELLCDAQRATGRAWQQARWTVADEHLVTGVTQAVLNALSGAFPVLVDDAPSLVVLCAEGDWHALAAQLFAEAMHARGRRVHFLGASTPAEDLARFVERRDVGAVGLSCSLPLHYRGIASLADAAHACGVPVLAGGRALTASRAGRLGADAFASDPASAAEVLDRWLVTPPEVDPRPITLDPARLSLEAQAVTLAALAFGELAERFPAIADYDDRQRTRTREDLEYIVRFTAAARLVDDPTVLAEFFVWLADVLDVRGVPVAALTAGVDALRPFVAEQDDVAAALLDSELVAAGLTTAPI